MSDLSPLSAYRYLALETMRRSGAPVVTPVWFVAHAGQLYFSAPAHTGKVKRLRHTPRGRVAPCDERGALLGPWQEVRITPTEEAETAMADQLLAARYGWQRRLLDAFGWLRRWRYVHYTITPLSPPAGQ
jgi:uncharacterized protein